MRWRGPKNCRARFARTIATANVVMKVIISKSVPRRPISGWTETTWVRTPKAKVTTNAARIARTGLSPALVITAQPTKPPIITIEPCDMSSTRRIP